MKKSPAKRSDAGLREGGSNDAKKHLADTSAFGCQSTPTSFFTPEYPVLNKNPPSTPKNESSLRDFPVRELSVTLDPASISSDQGSSPYWNERCKESQSNWWLPHRTASRGPASRSSGTSSNYQEVGSSFWKTTIAPSNSTSNTSLRMSLPSAIRSTASALVKGTRKIRAYPKDEEFLLGLIRQ